MPANNTAPKWFIIVCIVAIIWNLLGVMAFTTGPVMNTEALNQLPLDQQQAYNDMPFWAKLAFAIAVFSGTLGSAALLLKKPMAKALLIMSLIGVIVQMFHAYFIGNSWEVFGPGGAIMPAMIVLFAIYLILLANKAQQSQWLKP